MSCIIVMFGNILKVLFPKVRRYEGKEIHHKCHNRACCNLDHLELVDIVEHKCEHNQTRYKPRKDAAHRYWKDNPTITGVALAKTFGVSDSSACKWIKEWKCRD